MTTSARSLSAVHAAARRYLATTLGRGVALATVAGLALFLVLAWLLAGSGGWRPGSPLPLLLDGAAILLGGAALLRGRRLVTEALQERRVSRAIEAAAGLSEGDVQGALELSRTIPPGVSPALVARGERQLLRSLQGDVAALTGAAGEGARRVLRWAGWAAVAGVALASVLGIATPERAGTAWKGLLRPAAVLAGPTLPPVQVGPGTVELDRGSDLEIRVEAPLRDEVTLVWQVAGDVIRRRTLALDGGVGGHVIAAVTAETSYHVEAPDGARSPTFTAVPVDPLFVTDVTVRLAFPPHTGRIDEEYRGEVPPLRVPAGTEVAVEGRGNRLLSVAELRWAGPQEAGAAGQSGGGAATVSFGVTGTDFQGRWVPRRSGRGSWHFVDADGDPAEVTPPELEVEVVPDAAPQVSVAQPARDTVLPLSLRQPLVVQASDDYGVAWLELVAWRVTGLGEARPPVTQRIDAGGVPRVLVRPVMDVSGWELLPGDEVRWFVRVADNGPAAQEARTPERILRMPDAEELRREAGRELDEAARTLEELRAQAREAAETAREARRQASAPERSGPQGAPGQTPESGEVDFGSREELRRALEEEEARARQADSLAQALSDMSSSLSEAGAQDARLRSDLDELRSLLDELGGEEMQERLRELLDGMDEVDRAEARRALEEMAQRGEEAEARLEEAVERMRRAAARQQFATTTDEARDLARREEALARALGEEASPERARQQEALAREAGELERRMEELAARLDQLGEAEAARGVQAAQEGVQEARQGMQEAARQAEAGQGQAAAGAGQEAAEQMEDSAREMMEAREEMMRERAEAFRRALQQTVQDALALAGRQGELRELMRRGDRAALAALRAEVAAVQAGTANATRNLGLAARAARAGGGEREISATLGAALGELERTVTALDNPSAPGIPSPQISAQRALERLNEAALQALAASRALSEGGQGQPSAEETMEQLQQLAQEQAEVNNQASQLMPMELTPQAMQEQMQQLAQQQQQVASNVGQMSEQEGEGPLGDLEAMAREAEALARELEQGRLDGTTRERQERLFHRLLDAGRSLEKEEESTERESEAPGVVEPGSVLPLDAAALGILRFRPDAEALRRLPPAARALVVRYFQRLNEGGTAPAAPTGPGGGR